MSKKAMIMQYAAFACGMAGLFLGMGGEGNVQTGGEFSGSLFAAAMILILSALALGRMSFIVDESIYTPRRRRKRKGRLRE